ncbi:MAG TPA: DUF2059 domain-containing protein [Rhodanobacter sp.]
MKTRKRLGFIAGLMLAVTTGQAVAAPPTEQQVRQLMEVIGLGRSLSQMNTQVVASMKQALPCVSSNYWQDFIDQAGSQEFIGRLVPIYQKHFTAAEVDGMVKFYGSPLGQKVLAEMPPAMAEANQVGQQWSQEHSKLMIAKLVQAGTLGANGRCPASAFIEAPAAVASVPAEVDEEAKPTLAPAHARSARKHTSAKKRTSAKKKGTRPHKGTPVKKAKSTKTTKTTKKHHTTSQKAASGGQGS